jgi:ABC-type uncharacterized transport system auxiliary subunit
MRRLLVLTIVLCALLSMAACSKDKKNEPSITDKVANKVDQFNTDNANTIVRKIKSPIDKARATQNIVDEHNQDIDRALQDQ